MLSPVKKQQLGTLSPREQQQQQQQAEEEGLKKAVSYLSEVVGGVEHDKLPLYAGNFSRKQLSKMTAVPGVMEHELINGLDFHGNGKEINW